MEMKRGRFLSSVSCWSQTDPADPDVLVQRFSEQCGSANMELWLTAVYGYKGPLLVGHVTLTLTQSRFCGLVSASQPFLLRVWAATWPGASALAAAQQRAGNAWASPCSLWRPSAWREPPFLC